MVRIGSAVTALIGVLALGAGLRAHHGSADYFVDREVTVTGVVTEWRWSSPHTWVYLAAVGADGRREEWNGEGPPLSWAEQRGWSKVTIQNGEEISLVMYPSRRHPRAGLVKRIERRGKEALIVSRPWLDQR